MEDAMLTAYRLVAAAAVSPGRPRGASRSAGAAALMVTLLVAGTMLGEASAVVGSIPNPERAPVAKIGRGDSPAVVADPAGTLTVVWQNRRHAIMTARQRVGHEWTKPVRIGTGEGPQVVTDRAGNVTAAWYSERQGSTIGVAAAHRRLGGHWSRARMIGKQLPAAGYDPWAGDSGRYGAQDLQLEGSPGGAVIAAWSWGSYDDQAPFRIQAAYRPAGQRWLPARSITREAWYEFGFAVGIDAAGNVDLAYDRGAGGKARQRVVGQGWTGPKALPITGVADVAVGAGGSAVVLSVGRRTRRVVAVHRPLLGHWGPARTVARERMRDQAWTIRAVVGGAGTVTVTWTSRNADVRAATRPGGGRWQPPVQLAPAGAVSIEARAILVANQRGDVVATWPGSQAAMGRYRPAGHRWGPTERLAPRVSGICLQANGDVVVTWVGRGGYVKVRRVIEP